jgi:hypothetical protein
VRFNLAHHYRNRSDRPAFRARGGRVERRQLVAAWTDLDEIVLPRFNTLAAARACRRWRGRCIRGKWVLFVLWSRMVDNNLDEAPGEVPSLFDWRSPNAENFRLDITEHCRHAPLRSRVARCAEYGTERIERVCGHVFARQIAEPRTERVPLRNEDVDAGVELLDSWPQAVLVLWRWRGRVWRRGHNVFAKPFSERIVAEVVGQMA